MERTIALILIIGMLTGCASTKQFKPEAISLIDKSTEYAQSKNWSEMIRIASDAIQIDPSYPEAYVNRSWAYLEKGFYDEAFADCQKALELDSTNAAAHNNKGLFYLRTGQPDKAKGDFETACNGGLEVGCENYKIVTGYKPPDKGEFYIQKAIQAFNKKEWDGVIKYTSEIITPQQKNETALSIRAGAYAHKGMLIEAIKDCDAAIKMNPNSAMAYNNKGFVMELMGKKSEATVNYEFACNLKLALGCNNLEAITESQSTEIIDEKKIILNGLNIGMDIQIARKMCEYLLDRDWMVSQVDDLWKLMSDYLEVIPYGSQVSIGKQGFLIKNKNGYMDGYGFIRGDDGNGKVTQIYFSGKLTDYIYSARGVHADYFVEDFTKNFRLPDLPWIRGGWQYLSPYGYELTIMLDKSIDIKKIGPHKPNEDRRKIKFD
jgi:Tfp pilus assembly protein PilF